MRQRKKVWSICLVIALVFSSIFTWNEPALTAYASETKTEKIVVYVERVLMEQRPWQSIKPRFRLIKEQMPLQQ